MKNSKLIYSAAIAILSLGACNKSVEPEVTAPETYTFTVKASKGDGLTKALSLSGTTITATWEVNDEVTVYKGETEIGKLYATTPGENTTLEGKLNTVPEVNDELVLTYGSNDYRIQKGTSVEYIGEKFDYAKATVTVTNVDTDSKTITTSDNPSFESKQSIIEFTLKDSDGNALTSITELKIYLGSEYVPYHYITVTPDSATDGSLFVAMQDFADAPITLSAVADGKVYTKTVNPVTLIGGHYYKRSVKMAASTLETVTTLEVGKIIGTNGSIYGTKDAAEAETTAAAIIAYVGETGYSYSNGLALALADVSGYYVWDSDDDYESHECLVAAGATLHYDEAIIEADGIANTVTLIGDAHTHPAASAVASYTVPIPSGSSDWHLPSLGEWNKIVLGLTGETENMKLSQNPGDPEYDAYKAATVNVLIVAAAGDEAKLKAGYYWSSTEFNNISAWRVDFIKGTVGWYGKHGLAETADKVGVRAAIAF